MELDELEEAYRELAHSSPERVRHAVSQVVRDHQALPELLSIAAPELTTRPFEDSFEESGGPPPLDRWERWRSPGLWLLTAAVIVGAALLGALLASRSCSSAPAPNGEGGHESAQVAVPTSFAGAGTALPTPARTATGAAMNTLQGSTAGDGHSKRSLGNAPVAPPAVSSATPAGSIFAR